MKFSVLKYREGQEHEFDLTIFLFATKNKKNLHDFAKILNQMSNSDIFSVLDFESDELCFEFFRNNESDMNYGYVYDDLSPSSEESQKYTLPIKNSITESDMESIYNFVHTENFKYNKSIFLKIQKYKKDGTFYSDKKKAALAYSYY